MELYVRTRVCACANLCIRVRVYLQKDGRNCVRVGPVRCYFTGSNCRRKHSKHRQAAPGLQPDRYGTRFRAPHLFPILFYPRAPPRMSNRHVRSLARSLARSSAALRRHDRSARRYRGPGTAPGVLRGCEFEMNSRSSRTVPSEGIRFYGSLVGTRPSIIVGSLEIRG